MTELILLILQFSPDYDLFVVDEGKLNFQIMNFLISPNFDTYKRVILKHLCAVITVKLYYRFLSEKNHKPL